MSQWTKRLEIATNVAVLVVCLIIVAGTTYNFFAPRSPSTSMSPNVGEAVKLRGVEWSGSQKTLILAISTQCHFCSESVPFYKKLSPAAGGKGDRVIAVFPQPTQESKNYLSEKELRIDQVMQAPLTQLKVGGTPTLILVNSSGKIEKVWKGKLTEAGEQEVLSSL